MTQQTAVSDDTVRAAVLQACADVGFNMDALTPSTDLVAIHPAKAMEALHQAAQRLGKKPELRTPQDIADWLSEAPNA